MIHAGMGALEPNLGWLFLDPSELPNQIWATVFNRAGYHADDGHHVQDGSQHKAYHKCFEAIYPLCWS